MLDDDYLQQIRDLEDEELRALNSACVAELNHRRELKVFDAKRQLRVGQIVFIYAERENIVGTKAKIEAINRTKAKCRFLERAGRYIENTSVNVPLTMISPILKG